MKYRLLLLLAVALLVPACVSDQMGDSGGTSSSGPTGRIRGNVRLVGNLPTPATEPITQDQGTCGNSASLPRLAVSDAKGVGNAFIYLDGVKPLGTLKPRESVLVDQKDCVYAPHALAVPVGTKLEFTNSDAILHSAVGRQEGPDGPQTLFNIAQPVKGARNVTEKALTKPGVVLLTCEAGHPWMSAYVFVADHPYVSVSGKDGEFLLADVPAGTYKIKMWHEGVNIRKIHKGLQIYEYEEPYEITKEIVVPPNGEAVIDFDLELRAEGT
jgi:plastocyanin